MDTWPIGIFDSGVGGLGIFHSITQVLPHQDIVYVADNNSFPFGIKTQEQMHEITKKIVAYLINEHNVKMIVVACNTATVSSIDFLRATFSVPFVGVVPVVKPACEKTKTGKVAIMSTPLTATSPYINNLIQKFAHETHVMSIGCPGLADMVEAGMVGSTTMAVHLRSLIEPAVKVGADVIGLCSTHYPFIKEQLQTIVGPGILILDSNEPVARQTKKIFNEIAAEVSVENKKPRYQFFVTKDAQKFASVAQQLLGGHIVERVQEVVL